MPCCHDAKVGATTRAVLTRAAISGVIAEHIRKFWDPRMRSAILAHFDAGGAGLDSDVRKAVEELRKV